MLHAKKSLTGDFQYRTTARRWIVYDCFYVVIREFAEDKRRILILLVFGGVDGECLSCLVEEHNFDLFDTTALEVRKLETWDCICISRISYDITSVDFNKFIASCRVSEDLETSWIGTYIITEYLRFVTKEVTVNTVGFPVILD